MKMSSMIAFLCCAVGKAFGLIGRIPTKSSTFEKKGDLAALLLGDMGAGCFLRALAISLLELILLLLFILVTFFFLCLSMMTDCLSCTLRRSTANLGPPTQRQGTVRFKIIAAPH